MLALCRAVTIAIHGDPLPVDGYERELLQEFLEEAHEAINSAGTFVSVGEDE